MSIEVEALKRGQEAALRFAVDAADQARDELESTRRVLAAILADHGPFPYPLEERMDAIGDDDGIAVRKQARDGPLMIMFESASDRIAGLAEAFDREPPEPDDET